MLRLILCFLVISSLGFSANRNKTLIANDQVLQVTEANFSQITQSKKPVIIDINASWCSACKMLAPVFDGMSDKYGDKILFAKIDVDSQNRLSEKYQVTALPTVLFFKPGQKDPILRHVGAMTSEDFDRMISDFLKK